MEGIMYKLVKIGADMIAIGIAGGITILQVKDLLDDWDNM